MLYSGLVSISFRTLSPPQIVKLVSEAGLDAIEWGGDVHVPHGDITGAEKVRKLTQDAGLAVSSYGSYYRLACAGAESPEFPPVLDTAIALGVSTLRVWAGNKGTNDADNTWWTAVIDDARIITDVAAAHGIVIALEFHPHTLTDTVEGTLRLLEAVDHPHFRTYWQPPPAQRHSERLDGLRRIKSWLSNLHVNYFEADQNVGLEKGAKEWRSYFTEVNNQEIERYALLEFVPDNIAENFLQEAKTLKRLLSQV